MEKEEKTGKEPKKVPTKLAIGLIGGTAAIIVGGFAIAYIIFTDKPQENSQEPIQANYVVGNVITNETLVNGNTILERRRKKIGKQRKKKKPKKNQLSKNQPNKKLLNKKKHQLKKSQRL